MGFFRELEKSEIGLKAKRVPPGRGSGYKIKKRERGGGGGNKRVLAAFSLVTGSNGSQWFTRKQLT